MLDILWTGTQPDRPDLTAAAAAHPPKLGFFAVPWSPKQATPLSTLESEAESERKLEVDTAPLIDPMESQCFCVVNGGTG